MGSGGWTNALRQRRDAQFTHWGRCVESSMDSHGPFRYEGAEDKAFADAMTKAMSRYKPGRPAGRSLNAKGALGLNASRGGMTLSTSRRAEASLDWAAGAL